MSAPPGMAAPVMIRTAVPGVTVCDNKWPAAARPITLSCRGDSEEAPQMSSRRTAYPSIPELAIGGRSNGELMSSAST